MNSYSSQNDDIIENTVNMKSNGDIQFYSGILWNIENSISNFC